MSIICLKNGMTSHLFYCLSGVRVWVYFGVKSITYLSSDLMPHIFMRRQKQLRHILSE